MSSFTKKAINTDQLNTISYNNNESILLRKKQQQPAITNPVTIQQPTFNLTSPPNLNNTIYTNIHTNNNNNNNNNNIHELPSTSSHFNKPIIRKISSKYYQQQQQQQQNNKSNNNKSSSSIKQERKQLSYNKRKGRTLLLLLLLGICGCILFTFYAFLSQMQQQQLHSYFNLDTFSKNNNHIDDIKSNLFSFMNKRTILKWRGYLTSNPSDIPALPPKLYFPRHCPSNEKTCAKPVPTFIFAGSEYSGSQTIFNILKQHPQVVWTMNTIPFSASSSSSSTSSSTTTTTTTKNENDNNINKKKKKNNNGSNNMYQLFDDMMIIDDNEDDNDYSRRKDNMDDAAFESYLSQFPFLSQYELNNIEKQQVIVGEHAPHYLFKSFLTAKRIRENLPHVKLVFILRDPIDRAYTQFIHENQHPPSKSAIEEFDKWIDIELDILQKCGHTTIDWEGFIKCHQGNEIRATWNSTILNSYLTKGMYILSLLPFLEQFPPSQLYVTRTEDFIKNPSFSFQKLAKFLGIQEEFFFERNFYTTLDFSLTSPLSTASSLSNNNNNNNYDFIGNDILGRPHFFRQQQQQRNGLSLKKSMNNNRKIVPAMALMDEEIIEENNHDVQKDQQQQQQNNHQYQNKNNNKKEEPIQQQVVEEEDHDATHWMNHFASSSPLFYEDMNVALSTRYRLEKLFKPFNQYLMELFENRQDFSGWDYDVDCG